MRVRILFTNGTKTIDLFWLEHNGVDVYCGATRFDGKRSYHASGKVHSYAHKKKKHETWHYPLSELTGQFHLNTIALQNSQGFFKTVSNTYKYSGRKSDAILTIDSRTLPKDEQINVIIGLLEPQRFDITASMVNATKSEQVLLLTATKPWVYAILCRIAPDNE